VEVPTHHHQAVDRLGAGLVATAWAADGTVEALEFAGAPGSARAVAWRGTAHRAAPAGFAIGVQWHPEEGGDPRLFDALISAAGGALGRRPSLRGREVSGAAR
jgi:putative glutamine amidotransferase